MYEHSCIVWCIRYCMVSRDHIDSAILLCNKFFNFGNFFLVSGALYCYTVFIKCLIHDINVTQ